MKKWDKSIPEIVSDPKWQKCRRSLLGKWMSEPLWCIEQIKKYLGPPERASVDKLRIVVNYLTGSGFRSGKIRGEEITEFRLKVRSELNNRMVGRKRIRPDL